jgi:ABC-type multidrug transport system fused ATPase/permease subunit
LRFPKKFFDDHQTGYLMSRLTEDVDAVRWFFSNTIVYIISNVIRFAGGVCFLFYLEWRLAGVVLILLPALGWGVRYFSSKLLHLNHQTMEQRADLAGSLQESLSESILIKAYASEKHTLKRLISAWQRVFKFHSGPGPGAVARSGGLLDYRRPMDPGILAGVSGLSGIRIQPGSNPGFCQSSAAKSAGRPAARIGSL